MRRSAHAIFGLALAMAGCVPRAPTPPPAPEPRPVPSPSPVATPAIPWRDREPTPGTWVYRRDERGSLALFGITQSSARLLLRCDRPARILYLSLPGTGGGPLTVRTTSTTRTLAARPTGGTPPHVAVQIAPNDRLLDAIAFSRGRFAVEHAGTEPLVVPPYAEVGRVIEDCRG